MRFPVLIKRLLRLYPKVKTNIHLKMKRFGNEYGGFEVFTDKINSNSIIYSFGIGEDISFDTELLNRFNCEVFAYDPTPKVLTWIDSQILPKGFKFHPVGLSNKDGSIKFYSPTNPTYVSHTAVKTVENQLEIIVPCNKLQTLLNSNGHSFIDILKMDIEGFEYDVIDNILNEQIPINQILVEFHHNFKEIGNRATERIVARLLNSGYDLFSISEDFHEFSFIQKF